MMLQRRFEDLKMNMKEPKRRKKEKLLFEDLGKSARLRKKMNLPTNNLSPCSDRIRLQQKNPPPDAFRPQSLPGT